MTDVDTSFIAEMLRAIRADIAEIKQDVHELKLRQTILEGQVTNLMISVQLINERMDRMGEDMRLVKRRLDLVDAP